MSNIEHKMKLGYLLGPENKKMLKEWWGEKYKDYRNQLEGTPTGHIWNYLRTKNKNQRTIMNYRLLEQRRIHQFTRNINM